MLKQLIEIKKLDFHLCKKSFFDEILTENFLNNFESYSLKGLVSKKNIRATIWKIFLNIFPIPNNKNIENILCNWIEIIISYRKEYHKLCEKYLDNQNVTEESLLQSKNNNDNTNNDNNNANNNNTNKNNNDDENINNENNNNKDNTNNDNNINTNKDNKNDNKKESINIDFETKKLINLDLVRTYQDLNLFHDEKILTQLCNILYIYYKENLDISYKQGMNELISVFFLAFYPFYFSNNKKYTKEELLQFISTKENIILHQNEIYYFFHDEDEIASDLYFIFNSLMKNGIDDLYIINFKEDNIKNEDYKKYELFQNEFVLEENDEIQTILNCRCTLIVKEKLKKLDYELFNHLQSINLNCNIFLQRWLKCIFNREFDYEDVFILWDGIFSNFYFDKNNKNYGFKFIDLIALGMIIRIRDTLLLCDQNDCFIRLFKYSNIPDINELVVLAQKLNLLIEDINKGKKKKIGEFLEIPSLEQKNNEKTFNKYFNKMKGFLKNIKNNFYEKDNQKNVQNLEINTNEEAFNILDGVYNKYSGNMTYDDNLAMYSAIDFLRKNINKSN